MEGLVGSSFDSCPDQLAEIVLLSSAGRPLIGVTSMVQRKSICLTSSLPLLVCSFKHPCRYCGSVDVSKGA